MSMRLFHLILDMTLITFFASVESIVVEHPRGDFSLRVNNGKILKKHKANRIIPTAITERSKAMLQLEVHDNLPTYLPTIACTSGACIALLDAGPKGPRVK